MSWRVPLYFWALALVPLLAAFLIWALRQRRAALERFAEAHLLPTIAPDRNEGRLYWQAGGRVVAVTLLIIALAGPQWGFHWEEVHREGVDVMIALDTSRSMLTPDVKPNRLERAKLAVQDLLMHLGGDRVGLVAFAGSAFVQCPLTLDYTAFAESLRAMDVGIIPHGGTALSEAITVGIEAFEGRQGSQNAFILITDGEDHEGEVEAAAQLAANHGIKIYTVGIGTPEGEIIPVDDNGHQSFVKDRAGQVVKSRLDTETLKTIATTTGGAFLQAAGPSLGLDMLYTEHIAPMEKRELHSTMERRFNERFQWPLALAVLLLCLDMLIGERRFAWRQLRLWTRRAP